MIVPLTINYIKPDAYGVWLTLTSLVGWVAMFDIGIANGLRNRLSESLAAQDYTKSRIYVSTTYVIIGLIALFFAVIYFLFYKIVNWQTVFNSKFIPEAELQNVVSVVSILFLMKFVSDIINVVAAAYQMVSVSSILLFISNLGITLSVWILSKTTKADMVLLALSLSFIPFLISVVANIYLFNNKFKAVKPSFSCIDSKESKSIIGLGSQFFILQIIVLIIFQSDNILIAQFFSPTEVTTFNVTYKYYSIITIVYSIVLTPYWTAFTEAFYKKEYQWIKETVNRLILFWFISLGFLIFMVVVCSWVVKIWIGDIVEIPLMLSISICAYIAVTNWNAIFANFLNGVGKIRLQIYISVGIGLLNIPLSLFLVKTLDWGFYAMPIANTICLSFGAVVCFIQYRKIINNKAKGVWDK